MEQKVYRVRIVLKEGGVVEADVANPEFEIKQSENRLVSFQWQNAENADDQQLVFLDFNEVAAITMREVTKKIPGF